MSDWTSAIFSFLEVHHGGVQEKVANIGGQVAAVVSQVEDRKIVRKWRFSREEAAMFAEKLNKCVQDNVI
jgi:hypothetical protein